MAQAIAVLVSREPQHVEGLCTTCWTSTLWSVVFDLLSESGVTPGAAVWIGCAECTSPGYFQERA